MPRPWVISVFSTSYDLADYREAIVKDLKKNGVTVSAYEQADFPVEFDKHSHDSCLIALRRGDIAILIVDKRSGGKYYDINDKSEYRSITEQEYLDAIDEKIPIFVFINEKAWDERHSYNVDFNAFCKGKKCTKRDKIKYKKEFDRGYTCKYVEHVSTIDFIEKIQRAYDLHGISNWIDKYSTIDDFLEKVTGKLKGYSRKIVESLAVSQCNSLLKRHTSTAFGMTLKDVFNSEYYIEPPCTIESGSSGGAERNMLCDDIHNAICSDQSVLVYGEAGYGKTTILAKCFAKHVGDLLNKPSYAIPLFLPLKNKGSNYHFSIENYIDEELASTENTKLNHQPYPYMDISQIRARFYCDGFDEMAEKLTLADLDRIRQSSIFSYPLLLTCRQQFANRYINELLFSDKFAVRVRMEKWDFAKAKDYIENFCTKKGINEEDKTNVVAEIDTRSDLQEVLDSPLLITMFMWFVEQSRSPIAKITRVDLFNKWIGELAKRERLKILGGYADVQLIINMWTYSAWRIYLHKVSGDQFSFRLDDIINILGDHFSESKIDITPSCLSALFDYDSEYIYGTFHEQFLEYLVAKILIDACVTLSDPYPNFLKMVIRPEINRYFREIWTESSIETKEKVFQALNNQYISNLGDNTNAATLVRVHAIYHIGRLNYQKRNECLSKAFNTEHHISVLLSLYFGVIKMGQLDKEDEFYNHLVSNLEYNEANRGYHLAYYSDSIIGDELPFKDNFNCGWAGTLKAFERHFNSDKLEHFFLRRIDLVTMRQFVESRKSALPLTEEILKILKKQIEISKYGKSKEYENYNNKVMQEFEKLIVTYNNYK